jgi:hypothetical protein
MTRIPSYAVQPYDAPALRELSDLLLRDCGVSRLGKNVIAAADDPRIVLVRKHGLLDRLFNAAQLAMQLTAARERGGREASAQ